MEWDRSAQARVREGQSGICRQFQAKAHHLENHSGYDSLMSRPPLNSSIVYDSYWRFAVERHAMFERRLAGTDAPWTDDPILQNFRFTNVFRAVDRVSQYLIRNVQYRSDRSQEPEEVFFRTMLFKLFNKVETWELLERQVGLLSWRTVDLNKLSAALDHALACGKRVYSAAYIMPPPNLGHHRKHANHLALLAMMMEQGLPERVTRARSLAEVYDLLKAYPGLGSFLAFQYAIDLNYSNILQFKESDFVVAGPGALDGIAKCFLSTQGWTATDVIFHVVEQQRAEFARLKLSFNGLFGRPLQPIDCQNIFCEISKYARVAHPEVLGVLSRKRIKQTFAPNERPPLQELFLPPRWAVSIPLRHINKLGKGQARLL